METLLETSSTIARVAGRERRLEARRLADALATDSLFLTRAPRINLADGTLAAEEVFLRWSCADRPVSAALLAVDQADSLLPTGRWMLRAACTTHPPAADGRTISVAVPAAMLNTDFAAEVLAALAASNLPTACLELRLPESGLLDPATDLLLGLSGLRDRGVRLALSDFGMRFGAACMLRNLPLTSVHLDPSLTYDLAPGEEDAGFVESLVAMAHAVRLRVAARMIDTPFALAALRAIGVDEGAGSACASLASGAPRDT